MFIKPSPEYLFLFICQNQKSLLSIIIVTAGAGLLQNILKFLRLQKVNQVPITKVQIKFPPAPLFISTFSTHKLKASFRRTTKPQTNNCKLCLLKNYNRFPDLVNPNLSNISTPLTAPFFFFFQPASVFRKQSFLFPPSYPF